MHVHENLSPHFRQRSGKETRSAAGNELASRLGGLGKKQLEGNMIKLTSPRSQQRLLTGDCKQWRSVERKITEHPFNHAVSSLGNIYMYMYCITYSSYDLAKR